MTCFDQIQIMNFTKFIASHEQHTIKPRMPEHRTMEHQQKNETQNTGRTVEHQGTARHQFLAVYLSLALNSPVKIYSLIDTNKKLYFINIAKYTAEMTKL